MLITLVVGVTVFTAFVSLHITISGITRRSKDITRASDAAQAIIQNYENRTWSTLTFVTDQPLAQDEQALLDGVRGPATGTVTVQDLDTNTNGTDPASSDLKKVEVTLTFGPDQRTIKYASIISPSISGVE